jgi:lipoyl synthase
VIESGTSRWSGLTIMPQGRCAYEPTWLLQKRLWELRRRLELPDSLLIVEHDPVITMGRHGRDEHLRLPDNASAEPPLVRIDRGGEVTYHGPGQLTAYLIADLRTHNLGVKDFVAKLESVVIATLARFGISAKRREGMIGIWIDHGGRLAKVAAIGVRVARGVSMHGLALNVGDCLGGFDWMVPCGLAGESVTTMAELLDQPPGLSEVAAVLREEYSTQFGIDFRDVDCAEIASDAAIDPIVSLMRQQALRGARKPDWLKRELPKGKEFAAVGKVLREQSLCTVCEEARCPNRQECWGSGTATFMILGDVCSRGCRFCAVSKGKPTPPDPQEPARLAAAAAEMKLRHVVVTSVTRDDLPDGGAGQFADVIEALRREVPQATIEVLIPDFGGAEDDLQIVFDARPDVLNHNVETVRRLYSQVRPTADLSRSLHILSAAQANGLRAKSGLMVGLGEADHEVRSLLRELQSAGCSHVTIGQYLQPNRICLPVKRYWTPDEFESWRDYALSIGFEFVDSGALVRSSYHAGAALS